MSEYLEFIWAWDVNKPVLRMKSGQAQTRLLGYRDLLEASLDIIIMMLSRLHICTSLLFAY